MTARMKKEEHFVPSMTVEQFKAYFEKVRQYEEREARRVIGCRY